MSTVTTPSQPAQVMSYGNRRPAGRGFNWRMAVIVAVFGALIGFPVYKYVKNQINGGVEKVGDGYFVELQDLGHFRFDDHDGKLTDVPERFRKLDGQKVTMDGFMYDPNTAGNDTHSFQFVYNVSKCCYGGPPQVQERVFGVVPNGHTVYNPGQYTFVRLTGKLHVGLLKDPTTGVVSSIYTLEVAKQPEPIS